MFGSARLLLLARRGRQRTATSAPLPLPRVTPRDHPPDRLALRQPVVPAHLGLAPAADLVGALGLDRPKPPPARVSPVVERQWPPIVEIGGNRGVTDSARVQARRPDDLRTRPARGLRSRSRSTWRSTVDPRIARHPRATDHRRGGGRHAGDSGAVAHAAPGVARPRAGDLVAGDIRLRPGRCAGVGRRRFAHPAVRTEAVSDGRRGSARGRVGLRSALQSRFETEGAPTMPGMAVDFPPL